MAGDDALRADPVMMQGFAQALAGGAEGLRNRLTELDSQVGEMLGDWRGTSGNAYSSAWELWHRGACEVQLGLSILARSIAEAGMGYQHNDVASTQALRAINDA